MPKTYEQTKTSFGLTKPQIKMLRLIRTTGHVNVNKPGAMRVFNRLEDIGLVESMRFNRVRLTHDGKRALAQLGDNGSCVDLSPDYPDDAEVAAEFERVPMTDDELLQAWVQLWHDLWIDGDLEIAQAIPEALARRGHELQREYQDREDDEIRPDHPG